MQKTGQTQKNFFQVFVYFKISLYICGGFQCGPLHFSPVGY